MTKRHSRSRRSRETPGWAWMLLGLTIGLVVAGYIYVSDLRAPASGQAATASRSRPPSPSPQQEATAANPAAAAARGARVEAPAAEPANAPEAAARQAAGERFDFYEILPQTEVAASAPPEAEAEAGAARTAPAGEAPGSYVLQAGSFRTHVDADRRKASIAFLGYESHIQRATVDDEVVHRVLVGPIGTAAEVDNARRRLRDANIDTLVMKASD